MFEGIENLLSEKEKELFSQLKTEQGKQEFLRLSGQEYFKRNYPAFVKLLGYKDTGEFHKIEMEGISRFRTLESQPVRRLWFWSRGFFKTSLITEAHTLWLIVNNPNIRVLIVSYSLEVAKKPVGALRNHLMTNPEFRFFFREFCPKENKDGKVEFGTSENFTIPCRTKQLKEPTVMCAGVGTNITGLHFDCMKIDDLVNKDSVTNDTQVQSSKDYYSLLRPIFDNPTIPREDVIGTIYHFNDLHSDLQKSPDFEKSIIPAYKETSEGREFVFPERLNAEGWESLINDPTMSPFSIQSQWMLRPHDPSKAVFKEEWIKYYDELPKGMAEYICCDPASSQKKKSDYTVLERWGVDHEGKHYLLEGIRDRLTSFERIDRLFQMVGHSSNLKWVKYEVLGGRHGDLEVIKERQIKDQKFFLIKETKSTTSSKTDRVIQRLQGPYNAGMIFFPQSLISKDREGKTYDFVQLFKLEILQFPSTEHDDIIDCQSQMFEEDSIRGEKPRVPKKKEMTADDWDKFYDNIERYKRANPFLTSEQLHLRLSAKRLRRVLNV